MRIPSMLLLAAAVLLAGVLPAAAQQIGRNKEPDAPQVTLTVQSQLVVEAVVVKDKQGKFIPGLSAKDFVVTEDGVPQTVSFCEHQDLATEAKVLPVSTSKNEDITIYNRLAHEQIAPESMDNERYRNRRLIALYFDMVGMRPDDQMRALNAAQQFVRTQMTSVDLISILRYEGS